LPFIVPESESKLVSKLSCSIELSKDPLTPFFAPGLGLLVSNGDDVNPFSFFGVVFLGKGGGFGFALAGKAGLGLSEPFTVIGGGNGGLEATDDLVGLLGGSGGGSPLPHLMVTVPLVKPGMVE
jgi:hypothetical protein